MHIEIHKPELEQRVRRRIQSGQCHDVEELLTEALDALDEKAAQTPPDVKVTAKEFCRVV